MSNSKEVKISFVNGTLLFSPVVKAFVLFYLEEGKSSPDFKRSTHRFMHPVLRFVVPQISPQRRIAQPGPACTIMSFAVQYICPPQLDSATTTHRYDVRSWVRVSTRSLAVLSPQKKCTAPHSRRPTGVQWKIAFLLLPRSLSPCCSRKNRR